MGNKNYKNLGIPSEGTRNNRIFSGQFPSGCIPFLNNTGKSGSIDSFQESVGIHLGAIERRVARSACLRFEPRGTDNNGGLEAWSWDEARTCAFRVLSGETNNDWRPVTTGHSLSSANDGQHLAEWPAHLRGCAWSRYREKVDSLFGGTPACPERYFRARSMVRTKLALVLNGRKSGKRNGVMRCASFCKISTVCEYVCDCLV